MKLPWQKKQSGGGGMRLSSGWKRNVYPRRRLHDQLQQLEQADPESTPRGGIPFFSWEEMQARRPWRRR